MIDNFMPISEDKDKLTRTERRAQKEQEEKVGCHHNHFHCDAVRPFTMCNLFIVGARAGV